MADTKKERADQERADAELDKQAAKEASATEKAVKEAAAAAQQDQENAARAELQAATKARLEREKVLNDALAQNPPDGKELTSGEVRAPRGEEATDATTLAAIQELLRREQLLAQNLQTAQAAAAATQAGSAQPFVISEAILKSAQAANAAAELATLRLDRAGPGGPRYIVNGVEVNADGVPIAAKQAGS